MSSKVLTSLYLSKENIFIDSLKFKVAIIYFFGYSIKEVAFPS